MRVSVDRTFAYSDRCVMAGAPLVKMFTVPLWAVALAIAAVAPWCASALQAALERRRRERTRQLLREAGLSDDRRHDDT